MTTIVTRSLARSIIFLVAVTSISACAGVHEYTTGVPAQDSSRFFASVQAAAEGRGHTAWTSTKGDLTVEVKPQGQLFYTVDQGKIVVRTFPASGGSDADKEARSASLRGEHQALMDIARADARANKDSFSEH